MFVHFVSKRQGMPLDVIIGDDVDRLSNASVVFFTPAFVSAKCAYAQAALVHSAPNRQIMLASPLSDESAGFFVGWLNEQDGFLQCAPNLHGVGPCTLRHASPNWQLGKKRQGSVGWW